MTRGPRWLGVFFLALLAAALLALVVAPPSARADAVSPPPRHLPRARSAAIFPLERRTVRFTHRTHAAAKHLGCRDCHDAATTSGRAEDLLLPAGTACDRCHETDHRAPDAVTGAAGAEAAACGRCHQLSAGEPPRVARQRYPRPNLLFSHRVHEKRGIDCETCHVGVAAGAAEGRAALPSMKTCLDCHRATGRARGGAPAGCPTCHLTSGTVLRTSFPSGQLLPPRWFGNAEHGPGFAEHHAGAAGANSRFCGNCHRERECADCHDGRVRPRRLHPNDWLSLHGHAANASSSRCTSCHREQSFCLNCHQRLGLSETGPRNATLSRGRFHPPPAVWTDAPRTRGHHAWAAERHLDSCVSCHVERDCVACHATAARGGAGDGIGHRANPHPRGFTVRCRGAYRKNPRPCLVCHDPSDPGLARCD